MKKVLKVTQIIFTVMVIIMLPIVFFMLITSNTSFGVFGIRSFTVLSGSMDPIIPAGSIIFTRPTLKYSVGDVVTFRYENVLVTHRIIEENDSGFITKGDANNAADSSPVPPSNIIGKNIITVPYVGIFASYLRTIPGFAVFIVIPTVIFIVMEIFAIKREIEKEIEKKLNKKLMLNASYQKTEI